MIRTSGSATAEASPSRTVSTGTPGKIRQFTAALAVQTVTREEAPLYYDTIAEFGRLTGAPIVINTSFNVRGEPIVCTPHDAYMCFMRTNMDYLVVGHHLLAKTEQTPLTEDVDWRKLFPLD